MNIYLVESGLDISHKNSMEKTVCILRQHKKNTTNKPIYQIPTTGIQLVATLPAEIQPICNPGGLFDLRKQYATSA